jgi:pyruvate dehydrogenase E2 component (dihydrolipoamide acetyltransferase)
MPALGQGHEAGRVARWLKREGELVTRDEPLLEVEVEAAVIEVVAPGTGVLSGVRVREGELAPAGTVLAYLLAPAARPGSGLWRSLAERAARSWREAPHLFLFRDVDASQLIVAATRQVAGVTWTDLLLLLTATTLARHPAVNGGREEVDLALAVAVEDGRLGVVIRRADQLDLAALAARRAELEERARDGELRAQDVTGGTFSVDDLGEQGVDGFLPILGEGHAGALGVGRVAERVVPVAGLPRVRPVVTLTLACDHREVDATRAGRFLGDLAAAMEEPARWL